MNIEEQNLNEAEKPQLNIGAVSGSFSPVADSKATEALQFYEDCADNLPYYQTSEKDNGFDWDRCRAYCSVGKSYSHQRFMGFVAEWFGTTVKEMKLQWRNVNYPPTAKLMSGLSLPFCKIKLPITSECLAKKRINKPKTLIKHQTYKEKTNFKL